MKKDNSQKSLYRRKISLRLALTLLLLLLLVSLAVIDNYIRKYNICRAEVFTRQMIVLISSNSEDYKNYCSDKAIADIEDNKDNITGNYKIIRRDGFQSLLWWRLTGGDDFEYVILFDEQNKFNIYISSYPDGKFRVYSWYGPRKQKDN